jgi:hypothetical protein
MEILEAAEARTRDGGQPLSIGIGVHAGETAESEQEGIVGSAVNVAARICSVARPGELLVSDTVRALTRTLLQVRFVPRGSPRLKGVSEPIALFRVESAAPGGAGAAVASRSARWRRLLPAGPLGALLALGAVVLVLIVVPGLYVLRGGQAPSGSATPTGVASPSGSPAAAFPNADERTLLDRLPTSVTGGAGFPNCTQAPVADRATDATVSVVCTPAGGGAQSARYDVVADVGLLGLFFQGPEPAGDCSKGTGFQTTWQLPNPIPPNVPFLAGRLRCFQQGSDSWIWWTYDVDRIVARAVRSDHDWKALWEWWDVVGPALKE